MVTAILYLKLFFTDYTTASLKIVCKIHNVLLPVGCFNKIPHLLAVQPILL